MKKEEKQSIISNKDLKSNGMNSCYQKELVIFTNPNELTLTDPLCPLNELEPFLNENIPTNGKIIDDLSKFSDLIFDKDSFQKEKGQNFDLFIEYMVIKFETKLDEIFNEDFILNGSDINNDFKKTDDDILSLILDEVGLVKFVKIIIYKCVPKYFTIISTFMIMEDFLLQIQGINPYKKKNQIFFTCFLYISNYYEDSNVCLDFSFIITNLEYLLLKPSNCMRLIHLINNKNTNDYNEYELMMENNYIKFWINQE